MINKHDNVVAIFTELKKIELVKQPMPTISEEDVLIEYLYCGICGGDYSVYCGNRKPYPISLGHEFVGKILSVGKNVLEFSPGQYVVSDFNYRCNKCKYCTNNQTHLCVDNNIQLFSNRGFAKYASVHHSYLVPIAPPDYLPRACLIEPLSCVIHACNILDIKTGMNILICGGGGIGMLFCFIFSNIVQNVNVTIAETNSKKAELLYKNFRHNQYYTSTQREYDLIIDCSNSLDGLKFSLAHTPCGGRICIMSHLYGLETSFVYEQICKKELQCYFPLRNGEKENLLLATKYINQFWKNEYDEMLNIYNNIETAFHEKSSNSFCKQIVHSAALCIS